MELALKFWSVPFRFLMNASANLFVFVAKYPGVSWDPLGLAWVSLGPFWDSLGIPWGLLGSPWEPLATPWDPLGTPWGSKKVPRKSLWDSLGPP